MATPVRVESEDEDRRGTLLGWLFLGVLTAIFLAMALWAYRYADQPSSTFVDATTPATETRTTTTEPPSLTAAEVNAEVRRSRVTLSGVVPDEGAREQLVRIAEGAFGNGNVVDNLEVDGGVDLTTGVFNLTGTAETGDEAPEVLLLRSADLGLNEGEFAVDFVAPAVDPAVVSYVVEGDLITLSGTAPEETVRERLVGSAVFAFGEGSVDSSGLIIEPSTMEEAAITVEGLTPPGDLRAQILADTLAVDFPTSLVTNNSEIDLSEQALTDFEDQLQETLEANPILFDVGTSLITPEGVTNLTAIADAINAVPDRGVEIVGHTDNSGSDTLNQTLSERRAVSVQEKLVELGVDGDRLSTRGAGSTEPVVPNTSRENRQRNRRIEFNFERE